MILKRSNTSNKKNRKIIVERGSTIIMLLVIGKYKYKNELFTILLKIAKKNYIYIAGFIISWTPYAAVALYSAFISTEKIEPILTTLPSLFAKSSMLWSSVLYIFSNRKIRKQALMQLDRLRQGKKTETSNFL